MLTIPLCYYIVSTYSNGIRCAFGCHEMTPAVYIGFPTVTSIGLGLGLHRQDYVGYAGVRHGPLRSSFGRPEITPVAFIPFFGGHIGYLSTRVSSTRDISSSRGPHGPPRASLRRHGTYHRRGRHGGRHAPTCDITRLIRTSRSSRGTSRGVQDFGGDHHVAQSGATSSN